MKRMNKKLIAIIVILIILLIGLGIGIYFYYFSEKIEIKKDRFVFEYGKEVPFTTNYYLKDTKRMPHKKDYKITVKNQNKVEIKNKKIVTKGEKLLEVGTYTLEISYQKQKETFVVEVKDTTKPTFKTAPEKITLEQNSKDVDLTKFFESEDLSETKLTIQGDYDLSTLGNYELKIQASDSYRNTQEKSFILEVIDFESAKEEGRVSSTIDGTIYKSEAMIEYENSLQVQENTPASSNNQTTTITPTTPTSSNGYRRDIANTYISQMNAYRVANGYTEIPVSTAAQQLADRRVLEIMSDFSHNGSPANFGENIGMGSVGYDFFEAWKNSPSHASAILRPFNISMGVSVYEQDGMWYAVAEFEFGASH